MLEVTVWPDVYERAPELWKHGNILLVHLRVRERGERLTAGVIDAVSYAEDFAPPAWALEQREPLTARIAEKPANGYDAGGNGAVNSGGHAEDLVRTAILEAAAPPDIEEPLDDDGDPLPLVALDDSRLAPRPRRGAACCAHRGHGYL